MLSSGDNPAARVAKCDPVCSHWESNGFFLLKKKTSMQLHVVTSRGTPATNDGNTKLFRGNHSAVGRTLSHNAHKTNSTNTPQHNHFLKNLKVWWTCCWYWQRGPSVVMDLHMAPPDPSALNVLKTSFTASLLAPVCVHFIYLWPHNPADKKKATLYGQKACGHISSLLPVLLVFFLSDLRGSVHHQISFFCCADKHTKFSSKYTSSALKLQQ